jgi:indolepyruvate ferredoxin oxidoreductase
MAYKDEYEVARLHLEAAAEAQIETAVGSDVTVAWNLHPPVLRALGMDRKLRLGPWFRPVMRGLRAGKVLRGRWFDPFGATEVRRLERSLIEEYRTVVERLAPEVNAANTEKACRLAELPDMVRGYEDIKLANVARYRAELDRMRTSLDV